MRWLVLLLGIVLASLAIGCGGSDLITDSVGNVVVQCSGTVKTAQGAPVVGVAVRFSILDNPTTTDSKGHYRTPKKWVSKENCSEVKLSFSRTPHTRDVLVGGCGEQRVNISDWPEGT